MSHCRHILLLFSYLLSVVGMAEAQSEPASQQQAQEESSEAPRGDLGLAPGALQTGNLVISRTSEPEADAARTSDWAFTFHGYVRAPTRVGFGPGVEGEKSTKIHVPPQIPDGAYTDYRYTNNLGGPWAELQFHYGNDRAQAHVIMGAYNFSEAGYRDLQAQLGISQAFITLNFPRAFGQAGGLTWNVGSFMNSYGAPGRYDAGRYDTYLFGRTHTSGETLTATLLVSDALTLTLEHGVGARLLAQPLNRTGIDLPPYLPYAGDPKYGQQATTLVHHAHAGLTYKGMATLAAHYLTTWSDDAQDTEKDGRITVMGADLKLLGGVYGDGYVGYAHASSRNIMRLAPSLEFMHSYAGYSLRDNFFPGSDTGTGTIDSILFQYTYSIATLLRHPEPFWGQGPDVVLGLFGTLSWVDSDEKTNDAGNALRIPKMKSKFGGDVTYTMLSWLGASLRYDLVQPNMRNNRSAFGVLSPKLIVRTEYVTHEQVVLSYSRYFNKSQVDPAWPHTGLASDENVVALTASMWW
jgi:hypothetical protein